MEKYSFRIKRKYLLITDDSTDIVFRERTRAGEERVYSGCQLGLEDHLRKKEKSKFELDKLQFSDLKEKIVRDSLLFYMDYDSIFVNVSNFPNQEIPKGHFMNDFLHAYEKKFLKNFKEDSQGNS